MLAMKLVRLIEAHSDALSQSLTSQIRNSDRTSDYRKISPKEVRLAASEVYRNLGEWLLQKTDDDIASRFRSIAAVRASEGIALHHFVWALILTRDHLWRFLYSEAFADSIVELHAELELQQLLNQFFDRAIYYAIQGYADAAQPARRKSPLARTEDLSTYIIDPLSFRRDIKRR